MNRFYCARFYVTFKCNSRCYYCNVWRNPAFYHRELTIEEGKTLISQLYAAGTRYIDFTGGEPALYEGLDELVLYAKQLGIKTEVTSNCIPFGENYLSSISRLSEHADKFNVSLDTLNSATYHKIRGVDRLRDVKAVIEKISETRTPKIMAVVSEDNIQEIDDLILFAQKNKALMYLNPVFTYGGADSGSARVSYSDTILSKTYDAYTVVYLHFMRFLEAREEFPPCSANLRTLTLAPDGSLILPCYHAYTESLEWNGNLASVLSSDEFLRYQANTGKLPCCRGCKVIPYMGISFNYRFDRYFILQSYSEKLSQLKRDYTNGLPLQLDKNALLTQMYELLEITDSMTPVPHNQEEDCWKLEHAPHSLFDAICRDVYAEILIRLREQRMCKSDGLYVFSNAFEFQLRLWKLFVCASSTRCRDTSEDCRWLQAHLGFLLNWLKANHANKAAERAVNAVLQLTENL